MGSPLCSFLLKSFNRELRKHTCDTIKTLVAPYMIMLLQHMVFTTTLILNLSPSYHVTKGLPPDIMHDVLEGVLQYEVKELLKY